MTGTEQIAYASVERRAASRLWGAAILCVTGLGLIALGGCFLIGVLVITTTHAGVVQGGTNGVVATHPIRAFVLNVVLYGCAAACGVGAAVTLVKGVRKAMSA